MISSHHSILDSGQYVLTISLRCCGAVSYTSFGTLHFNQHAVVPLLFETKGELLTLGDKLP